MNDILFKVDEAIRNYRNKYERNPNAILINEDDWNLLQLNSPMPYKVNYKTLKEKLTYEVYNLKIIPIKYGEVQAVEVLE